MRRRLEENGETSHYANIASGGASGLLFGLVAGRSPHTMLAGSIVGTVLGASSEITEAKFESWRLRLLLESRHPELVGGTLGTATATDKVLSGERPWYWPGRYPRTGVHAARCSALSSGTRCLIAWSLFMASRVGWREPLLLVPATRS
eukprot:m.501399 g.501399  ORF g.501399 m.501399 type:complete len:148 (+) comp21838_c0_seq3:102-545(+)